MTCDLQLIHCWKDHYARTLVCFLDWHATTVLHRCVSSQDGPFREEVARLKCGDRKEVDRFYALVSPQFKEVRDAAKSGGRPVNNEDRERAIARMYGPRARNRRGARAHAQHARAHGRGVPTGRMGDWLAWGLPVPKAAASAVGGADRRGLERVYKGTTAAGVAWEDGYPLARRAGLNRLKEKSGAFREVWTAVRNFYTSTCDIIQVGASRRQIITGRPMIMYGSTCDFSCRRLWTWARSRAVCPV